MTESKIKDGTGTGRIAGVNRKNQLVTHAVTETEGEFINSHDQLSFLLYIDITPTAANDVFCYIKNTHATHDMEVNWYRVWTEAAAEAIDVYIGHSGTPAGTTTMTPRNTNITSNATATGEFYEGADITGLSNGVILDRLRISGDGKDVVENFPGKIIIPQGGVLTFQVLNGAIPVELTVSFHYKVAD